MIIRLVRKGDNDQLERVIRDVLRSYGANGPGFAFADPELLDMVEAYQAEDSCYYVLEENGKIFGGAGISPLAEEGINACELQKMYFHPKARGRGFGKKLIQLCLEKAKELAYSHVYLETLEEMHEARSLYESVGFKYIDHRMGATGHSSCPVFMLKYL